MIEETGKTRRGSSDMRDGDDGTTPGAVKRPWSKPTVSVLHRLVRTHTGTSTVFTTEPESFTYIAQS